MARHLGHVGQQIADYRLLRLLGGGGFGDVYLAEQVRDHSQVAVKLLHIRLSDKKELKAFINEARMIRLQHVHIVPLLDFDMSEEEIPFLVMEYAAQGTLRDRHPKGKTVPLPLIVDYAQQVASALQYAHEQHIIHRDVKPHNMLLREDGTVLLSDFGLVAVMHNSGSQSSQQGAVGTITYMAPEQIRGQAQAASDQYGFGVVVYEWITGRRPFAGTVAEIAMQHAGTPPPSLVAQVPGLSRAVEEVVLKALAKDPRDRFGTVRDFTAALEETVRGAPALPEKYKTSPIYNNEPILAPDRRNLLVSSPGKRRASGPRVDWSDAPEVSLFYGREQEKAQLSRWVLQENCRVVGILGMGGIGKSALSVSMMHQLAEHFEVVIFHSLRDAPALEELLADCLQVLSPQPLSITSAPLEQRLSLLVEHLRKVRALLVLDNLESLLQDVDVRGHFRPSFEGYGQLLSRVAVASHQSCLLFTSREKPAELRELAARYPQVHTLRLAGLDIAACKQILEEKEMGGTPSGQEQLIEAYSGNPLALKIVAETIVDLFGGELSEFLTGGTLVFGNITDLLNEQFARLSALEQGVLCFLAVAREPMTLDELQAQLISPISRTQLFEAVEGLRRRSLIEPGKRAGSFTLQSVVLEYVTAFLIAEGSSEIQQHRLSRLIQHGLSQAGAKEYVRQTQERLLVVPLLADLQSVYWEEVEVEEQLRSLLDELRKRAAPAQGYGPANLIALLRLLRGNLNALDLSQLRIRGAYLRGIEMQDTTLSGATLRDTVFTEAFDIIKAVAASPDGKFWAAGSVQGKVRVWDAGGQTLHLSLSAHTDIVALLAFSPDGRALASAGYDGTVKLWDVEHGSLLWVGWHTDIVTCVAFAPDGRILASGGADAVIRFWDVTSGTNIQTLSAQGKVLFSLAWNPNGMLLASGSFDGDIQLWHLQEPGQAHRVAILAGHTSLVMRLAFSPDGAQLVSGCWDNTVKLWDIGSLHLRQTLSGHRDRVDDVAWSEDGRLVASAGFDKTICIFDVERGSYRAVLHGHTAIIYNIAFTPDSRGLLSGSEDGTVRVWDVTSGQCVRVIEGYAVTLHDVAWSPDGTRLASVGTDALVSIWDVTGGAPPKVLRGHSWHLFGVVWSPDGRLLASSGRDNAIRLWDPTTGECIEILRDPDHVDTVFYGVAWSPDGRLLACGSYVRGVRVWDMVTRTSCWVGQHPTRARRVAWSPDGARLVGSGDDGSVCLWAASDGTLLGRLQGHSGRVMSVTWSPDGMRLASAGGGQDGGELFVWDGLTGELIQTLQGHSDSVFAVVWHPTGDMLVSGGCDGTIRWWDVERAVCLRTYEGHKGGVWSLRVSPDGRWLASCGNDNTVRVWNLQSAGLWQTLRHDRPYERLNITGIKGLNEAEIASLLALGAIDEKVGSL